jgi:hypothetical protein
MVAFTSLAAAFAAIAAVAAAPVPAYNQDASLVARAEGRPAHFYTLDGKVIDVTDDVKITWLNNEASDAGDKRENADLAARRRINCGFCSWFKYGEFGIGWCC